MGSTGPAPIKTHRRPKRCNDIEVRFLALSGQTLGASTSQLAPSSTRIRNFVRCHKTPAPKWHRDSLPGRSGRGSACHRQVLNGPWFMVAGSTSGHARPWDSKSQRRDLMPVLRRPVELATRSGHCQALHSFLTVLGRRFSGGRID